MKHTNVNIILADDDQDDLELIEEAILSANPDASLHKFPNGKAAVEYLDALQDTELPCLIILDYNMPEMNGAEAFSIISKQARFEGIPRIILSTSNVPLYIHQSKNSGATEYFVKPDTKSELESLAQKMLAMCA